MKTISKLFIVMIIFFLSLKAGTAFALNDSRIFRGGLERTGVYEVKTIEEGKKYLPPSADIIRSAPVYHNNNIFYGSNDHFLYSVNIPSGELNWKFETGGAILASPALSNGTLYFGGSDRALYAIDEKSGEEQWYFETKGAVTTSPLVIDGTVFFGCGDGFVYAINAETGSLVWQFSTNSPVNSSPCVLEDILYVGDNHGKLHAIDIKNGKGVWSFQTNGPIEATPAVTEKTVFAGSHDSCFYAIDRKTGEKLWSYKTFGPILCAAAIYQNSVFFGSEDTRVYALDASNGKLKWQFPAMDSIIYAPVIVNGLLYVSSTDWYVYIIDPSNGNLLKSIYNGGPNSIPPTVGGSHLFTSDGPAHRIIAWNITKIAAPQKIQKRKSPEVKKTVPETKIIPEKKQTKEELRSQWEKLGLREFIDKKYNASFLVPSDFSETRQKGKTKFTSKNQSAVITYEPMEFLKNGGLYTDARQMVDYLANQMKTSFNAKIHGITKVKTGNYFGFRLQFSWVYDGARLNQEEIVIQTKHRLYSIGLVAAASVYKKYLPLYETAAASFTLSQPAVNTAEQKEKVYIVYPDKEAVKGHFSKKESTTSIVFTALKNGVHTIRCLTMDTTPAVMILYDSKWKKLAINIKDKTSYAGMQADLKKDGVYVIVIGPSQKGNKGKKFELEIISR